MASNAIEGISAIVRDIKPDLSELDAINKRVDRATLMAMKASQTQAKAVVKQSMRGRPRWAQRGAIGSGKSVPAVNLHRTPNHISRSGGIGSLTGTLRGAVGGMKRPKRTGNAAYSGGIGAGGPESITNIYRKIDEGKYPYMRPGVQKAQPRMRAAWERAWAKAVKK